MTSSRRNESTSKGWMFLMGALILLAVLAAASSLYYQYKHPANRGHSMKKMNLEEVKSVKKAKDAYDVIVIGTDPEGVAAAVSAARNGLSTLLVDGRNRDILGGLMTLGWINSIDMNYSPNKNILGKDDVFNKGFFSEWYAKIEGDSFDVNTAANAFYDLAKNEKNIDILLKTQKIEPLLAQGQTQIQGATITLEGGNSQVVKASAVIDATQDGDFAAAAGVPFTIGHEDIGDPKSKMAVTLAFRLKNVTPEVWDMMAKRLNNDDDVNSGVNEVSVFGYKEMSNYPPLNKERAKMRGLNMGRENDNTVLINSLQIFNVDTFNPKSVEEAFEIGKKELPNVVAYMQKSFPEFAHLELDGTAPELYVRETRHMQGEYRLSIVDVCTNNDQWDRIGFGSYAVDIQRIAPTDSGNVVCKPKQYAIPFRSIVPQKVDGLLVVGRAASYDTLPHGSARVMPTGMAEGEAAGAAVKIAQAEKLTFRQMTASKEVIAKLQDQLTKQGMEIQPMTLKPQPFMEHKEYEGLKTAMMLGLASGAYNNDFHLDDKANPKRMTNLVNGAKKMKPDAFKGDATAAIAKLENNDKIALTLEQASYTLTQAIGLKVDAQQAQAELLSSKLLTDATLNLIGDKQNLTNADTYMMIRDLKIGLTGKP
ncbi:FAD-dependent oxidoreductase [Paenibacillus sp. SYP-B3998]|uniref:FAD-dependent oxidoreductase n=1 Tax=Paenibacillus sp. SYP-B3998 TaxID=2678564 RepID=A0A6G3ZR65_9BACL|nr:FAD-dependent oxidoreductase [Paenibacillus sp. SYP-B3998]NEW04540.1 FAD-dependent oxidoreductase [Paenibacillus sp. SYP-B3998]